MNNNTNSAEMKECPRCKVRKSYEEFGRNRSTKDGFDHACRNCRKVERAKYHCSERHKETQKRYRERNKDKIKQSDNEYRRTEKGREVRRVYKNKRDSRKRSLISTLTTKDWESALEYFNHQCAYCGKSEGKLDQEHVVPVAKDGHYTKQNIIPSCGSCNYSKRHEELFEWYKKHEKYDKCRLLKIMKWTGISEQNKTQQITLF